MFPSHDQAGDGKVGDKVRNAIEENRAILKDAKRNARNNNWEPDK